MNQYYKIRFGGHDLGGIIILRNILYIYQE